MHRLEVLNPYSALIQKHVVCCSEGKKSYHHLMERHLHAIWFEQKYFKNLTTSSGEVIEVLSPGIWNSEAGPDFLKASIRVGNAILKGDIEIHLQDFNWEQHQHHLDARYNNVILHLSFWPSDPAKALFRADGHSILRAYLEPCLTIPMARILQLIDLDLYPYKYCSGSGRCAQQVFKRMNEKQLIHFFQHAAYHRLEAKYNRLAEKDSRLEMQIAIGLAQALGYKQNSERFIDLLFHLQQLPELGEEALLSWCMRATGFFSEHYQKLWGTSAYYRDLEALSTPFDFFPSIHLELNQIRPLNHPIRRLAALILLLRQGYIEKMYTKLIAVWHAFCKQPTKHSQLLSDLCEIIPSLEHAYWNHYYTFESTHREETLPLIGETLKKEIVVNVFLPILYAHIIKTQTDEEAKQRFYAFYHGIPAAKTAKSNYLSQRFLKEGSKLFRVADLQQGAYQLHKDFCVYHEASCEGCPFPDRIKGISKNWVEAKLEYI